MSINRRLDRLEKARPKVDPALTALNERRAAAVEQAYNGEGCEALAQVIAEQDRLTGSRLVSNIHRVYGGNDDQSTKES